MPEFPVQNEIRGERRKRPSRDCANRHAAAALARSAGDTLRSFLVGDIFCGHPYLAASEKCRRLTDSRVDEGRAELGSVELRSQMVMIQRLTDGVTTMRTYQNCHIDG